MIWLDLCPCQRDLIAGGQRGSVASPPAFLKRAAWRADPKATRAPVQNLMLPFCPRGSLELRRPPTSPARRASCGTRPRHRGAARSSPDRPRTPARRAGLRDFSAAGATPCLAGCVLRTSAASLCPSRCLRSARYRDDAVSRQMEQCAFKSWVVMTLLQKRDVAV